MGIIFCSFENSAIKAIKHCHMQSIQGVVDREWCPTYGLLSGGSGRGDEGKVLDDLLSVLSLASTRLSTI